MTSSARSLSLLSTPEAGKHGRAEVRNPEVHPESEIGSPPPVPRPRFLTLLLITILVAAGSVGVFLLGWIPRIRQEKVLAAQSETVKTALPQVMTAHPRPS